jgi:tRNA pseudouridine38-40 synthase
MLCLEIEADAFLRHMVRSLVGTMIEVGQGDRSLDDFRRLLDGAPREAAGLTAPAHGLFLWGIRYARAGSAAAGRPG